MQQVAERTNEERGAASLPRSASPAAYNPPFERAYQAYFPKVFAFVYNRVNNSELAEELTADILEKADTTGRKLRHASAYPAWLFRIARSVVVGYYRRPRKLTGMDWLQDFVYQQDLPDDPEFRTVHNDGLVRLRRHLRTLSHDDQDLISLRFNGELSFREVAQSMRISEEDARAITFRALRRLRDAIEAETATDGAR